MEQEAHKAVSESYINSLHARIRELEDSLKVPEGYRMISIAKLDKLENDAKRVDFDKISDDSTLTPIFFCQPNGELIPKMFCYNIDDFIGDKSRLWNDHDEQLSNAIKEISNLKQQIESLKKYSPEAGDIHYVEIDYVINMSRSEFKKFVMGLRKDYRRGETLFIFKRPK